MNPRTLIGIGLAGVGIWLLLSRRVSAQGLQGAPGTVQGQLQGQPGAPMATGPSTTQKVLSTTQKVLSAGVSTGGLLAGLFGGGGAAAAAGTGAAAAGTAAATGGAGTAVATGGAFLTSAAGIATLGIGAAVGTAILLYTNENHNDRRDALDETLEPLGHSLSGAPGYQAWLADNRVGTFWLMHTLVGIEGAGANDRYYPLIHHATSTDALARGEQTILAVLIGAARGTRPVVDPRSRQWAAETIAAWLASENDWTREQAEKATGQTGSSWGSILATLRAAG